MRMHDLNGKGDLFGLRSSLRRLALAFGVVGLATSGAPAARAASLLSVGTTPQTAPVPQAASVPHAVPVSQATVAPQAQQACQTVSAPLAASVSRAASVVVGAGAANLTETRGTLVVDGLRTPPGRLVLPYIHHHYPDRVRPTVFLLGGGPGQGNLKNQVPPGWLDDFDVVVLEYRGVGRSSLILDTPHFGRTLLTYGEGTPAQQAATLDAGYRAAFADLARHGIAFDEFSVDALADDIETLRRQLGLEQIYLAAHSFGTRVILSYQTRYRAHAAGSVLFSMNTPGGFLWQPAQTRQVWTRYRDALAASQPERAAALDQLLRNTAPRPSRYGFLPVNNARAMMIAFFLSFNSAGRDAALAALSNSRRGASLSWYLYSLGYPLFIRFGFNWADFFVKAYTSDCNREAIRQLGLQGQDTLFGSPSAPLFAGTDAFEAAGGRCDVPALEPDYRNTLAVIGQFDPSTPIERKPAGLPPQHFIVIPDAGHADVFFGKQADSAAWLRRFFLHPDQARPPGAGPGCAQ